MDSFHIAYFIMRIALCFLPLMYFVRIWYYGVFSLIFFCFHIWVLTVFLSGKKQTCYPNTVTQISLSKFQIIGTSQLVFFQTFCSFICFTESDFYKIFLMVKNPGFSSVRSIGMNIGDLGSSINRLLVVSSLCLDWNEQSLDGFWNKGVSCLRTFCLFFQSVKTSQITLSLFQQLQLFEHIKGYNILSHLLLDQRSPMAGIR